MILNDNTSYKFQIIYEMVKSENNVLSVSMLCDIAQVSRSGYYRWVGAEEKRRELEEYHVDLSKYDNIIIGSPCWFGTYAPPIHTFLLDNKMKNKNIYLFVCNGGNLRNTWKNYEEVLKGNHIVSKLDLVYPIKNGIEDAKKKTNEWITSNLK